MVTLPVTSTAKGVATKSSVITLTRTGPLRVSRAATGNARPGVSQLAI
jgi:hypothetical protein